MPGQRRSGTGPCRRRWSTCGCCWPNSASRPTTCFTLTGWMRFAMSMDRTRPRWMQNWTASLPRWSGNSWRNLAGTGDALVLLTADHGQSETHPLRTIYLNTDLPASSAFSRATGTGSPCSCRLARATYSCTSGISFWKRRRLLARAAGGAGRRLSHRRPDRGGLLRRGAGLGDVLGRAGNLVVLPYRGEAVWWYEKDRFEQKNFGHHGGLTPQEMEIPLLGWVV